MVKDSIKIKINDKVKIIAGKDKGKVGKVLKINAKKNGLIVENINIVKRHTKPSMSNRQGGILESEAHIHWSNVMLMCNKCIEPVRVKMKILEDGKKVRVCRNCSEIIDA